MAPIPHIRKKVTTNRVVSVQSDLEEIEALRRQLRRQLNKQKQELMDYTDAVDFTDEEKEARRLSIDAVGESDIKDIRDGMSGFQEAIDSMKKDVDDTKEENEEIKKDLREMEKRTTSLETDVDKIKKEIEPFVPNDPNV